MRTTEDMARDARHGDPETSARLYERIAPSLFAWARLRIRPNLERHFAPEDLIQEVWWRAYDAFDRFDPDRGSFRSWLFTIATRSLLNAMRKLRSGSFVSDPAEIPEDLAASVTRISQRIARDEVLAEVIQALKELDPEDRALAIHCGLEGLPTTSAAELLSIGPEAARKRWQRLRKRLQGLVSSDEFFV